MKLKVLLVWFIIIVGVFIKLQYDKTDRINSILETKTVQYNIMYDMLYHSFKEKAQVIYDTVVKKKDITSIYQKLQNATTTEKESLRDDLYKLLIKDYNKLKYTNLEQFHFHLKNNESFLRFHKPLKFGDNLTSIRETIEYVNKNKTKIDGFEAGRIVSGYRFVYPILDENNKHLGSVEVSFNIASFVSEFMDHYQVLANLHINENIINKKVFDDEAGNYQKSPISGYVIEKHIIAKIKENTKEKNGIMLQKTMEEGLNIVNNNESISLYDTNVQKILSFLPIQNPITNDVVAFLNITSSGKIITNIVADFYLIFFIISIFISIISYLLYKTLYNHIEMNKELQEKVDKEVEKNIQNELRLFEQSKMAQMGSMIGNIAHQWRQPLSHISIIASGVKVNKEFGMLDVETLPKEMDDIVDKVNYLSDNITTFRNFLKEKKDLSDVILQERIDIALDISSVSLKDNGIRLENNIDYNKPIHMKLVVGELAEVIINIINNAKDALVDHKVTDAFVKLDLIINKNNAIITIEDNGGGIPQDVLPRIFEQYFTTKEDNNGTGLGLHMSHQIIVDSLKGKLYVENTDMGAKFFIELPI